MSLSTRFLLAVVDIGQSVPASHWLVWIYVNQRRILLVDENEAVANHAYTVHVMSANIVRWDFDTRWGK